MFVMYRLIVNVEQQQIDLGDGIVDGTSRSVDCVHGDVGGDDEEGIEEERKERKRIRKEKGKEKRKEKRKEKKRDKIHKEEKGAVHENKKSGKEDEQDKKTSRKRRKEGKSERKKKRKEARLNRRRDHKRKEVDDSVASQVGEVRSSDLGNDKTTNKNKEYFWCSFGSGSASVPAPVAALGTESGLRPVLDEPVEDTLKTALKLANQVHRARMSKVKGRRTNSDREPKQVATPSRRPGVLSFAKTTPLLSGTYSVVVNGFNVGLVTAAAVIPERGSRFCSDLGTPECRLVDGMVPVTKF